MGSKGSEEPTRRYGDDRRKRHHLLSDWQWAYKGRRRAARRDNDDNALDWYHPGLMLLCVGILVLSGVDATATLLLLSTGAATEANPFMRWFIEHDVQTFVNLKTVLTGAALVFLVACSNTLFFRRVRVKWLLCGVFGIYVALVGYEFALLMRAGHL